MPIKEKTVNPILNDKNIQVAQVYTLRLGKVDVVASQALTTIADAVSVPIGGEIIKVQFNHLAESGTALQADVFTQAGTPASVLSAAVDVDAATPPAAIAGTVLAAKKDVAAGSVLTLRGAAGGGESITGLSATITIRPNVTEIKNV